MQLIEWEVAEDNYQEQIIIPVEKRKMAEEEGIDTEVKQKVTVRIMNPTSACFFFSLQPISLQAAFLIC
jgi:hypothetical protein